MATPSDVDLVFACKPFDALSLRELYEILHLRDLVFVVGQKITSEPEVDGADPGFHHLWGRTSEGRVLAPARLDLAGEPARVGRVAVHPDHQRRGLGTRLMHAAHDVLDGRRARLHAQAHLEPWYERLGWRREGAPFVEAEIPHVCMVRPGGGRGRQETQ